MEELLKLAKQSLSIIETATLKDGEIKLIIKAGIKDMERQGIFVDLEDELIIQTIMMYVKANFGNVDLKEKINSKNAYSSLCNNLGLSDKYKEK